MKDFYAPRVFVPETMREWIAKYCEKPIEQITPADVARFVGRAMVDFAWDLQKEELRKQEREERKSYRRFLENYEPEKKENERES